MPQCPYNPQEVLSPLLKRFGRHLRGRRESGFGQMTSAVSEELRVDSAHARRLVESLVHAGLVAYELPLRCVREQFTNSDGEQVSEEEALLTTVTEDGFWRIGLSA